MFLEDLDQTVDHTKVNILWGKTSKTFSLRGVFKSVRQSLGRSLLNGCSFQNRKQFVDIRVGISSNSPKNNLSFDFKPRVLSTFSQSPSDGNNNLFTSETYYRKHNCKNIVVIVWFLGSWGMIVLVFSMQIVVVTELTALVNDVGMGSNLI